MTQTPELLKACWADMAKRKEFIEALEMVGFNPDCLREIQSKTGHEAHDILDVLLDIAYDVEPITREMRAAEAKKHLKPLSSEGQKLLDVMLENYIHDGVWTLTIESFRDLLMQRYGSLSGACQSIALTLPEAMALYAKLQQALYAA